MGIHRVELTFRPLCLPVFLFLLEVYVAQNWQTGLTVRWSSLQFQYDLV